MNKVIPTDITVPQILEDLASGLTRYRRTDAGWGSIQEKYGLSVRDIDEMFRHPALKNRKTRRPFSFRLWDDKDQLLESQQRRHDHIPAVMNTYAEKESVQQVIAFARDVFTRD